MVPKGASKFSVRFQRGADLEHSDVFYHFSACFGDSPVVVRNARRSNLWGLEERDGPFPFTISNPLLLTFTVALDCFEVEVTGVPHHTFKSRDGLPLSSVTHLAIEGSISVRAIHIPVENMPRNLRLSIPGQAKVGDMIFLRGTPPPGAQNFVINVQSGPGKLDDIMYHFSPRMSENKVVQNSRLDDEWGTEEKVKSLPFTDSNPFSLLMACSSLGFETWVDGQEFSRFSHRHELTNACTVFIEGDLSTEDIIIDSAQCALPCEWEDGFNLNKRKTRLQAIYPEMPLVSRISGGLDKDCFLFLSGEVPKEPTRFYLNLQCDSADDADIALQYNPRWDDKDPILVLNSREDDEFGSEVKVKEDKLALTPGLHFDIAILFTGSEFRLSANGIPQIDFPMRIDTKPSYISISGNIVVHRLLIL